MKHGEEEPGEEVTLTERLRRLSRGRSLLLCLWPGHF